MATPPPGYVRDLVGAFDQAGAPASAPPAWFVPATSAAPATAAAAAAAMPGPLAAMPPATAALFIPPAPVPVAQAAAPAPTPAPALASVYINKHVPLVLSLSPANYSTWRTMFELTFSKFGVADHVLGHPRPNEQIGRAHV